MNYYIFVHRRNFPEYRRAVVSIFPNMTEAEYIYSQVVLDLTDEEATVLKLSVPDIIVKPLHLL